MKNLTVLLSAAVSAVIAMALLSMPANNASASSSYYVVDQFTCESLPFGNPSWDQTMHRCLVSEFTLTLNSGDSLIINGGVTFDIFGGTINNNGGNITAVDGSAIDIVGNTVVNGTIINNSGGIINVETAYNGSLINNSGGSINLSYGGILRNNSTGTFSNFGTVSNSAIINNDFGKFNNGIGGVITNLATITSSGRGFTNSGTITNNPFATITNNFDLTNSGTITNNAGDIKNGVGGYAYQHRHDF